MTLAATLTAAEAIAGPLLNSLRLAVPLLGTGEIAGVVTDLEQIIPLVISEATALLQPIQNIIAQLQGNGAVTAEQLAALGQMNAKLDAAFNAIAATDGV